MLVVFPNRHVCARGYDALVPKTVIFWTPWGATSAFRTIDSSRLFLLPASICRKRHGETPLIAATRDDT